ncbi:hypothetical protein [Aeromicrobium sp. 179-A 4D2 NHS]|uniref:hypothetical protein n=1 Tax=Aeromicrobium sp. 179-A 4D2 NHS TaxID=3142375 RepID=UPI0039A03C2B
MNWSDLTNTKREAVSLLRLYAQCVREQNPRIRAGLNDRLNRKVNAYGRDNEMTTALTGLSFNLMRRLSARTGTPVSETVTDLVSMVQSIHTDEPKEHESGVLRGLELLNAIEAGENPAGLANLIPRTGADMDHREDIRFALDVAHGLMARVGADPMRLA